MDEDDAELIARIQWRAPPDAPEALFDDIDHEPYRIADGDPDEPGLFDFSLLFEHARDMFIEHYYGTVRESYAQVSAWYKETYPKISGKKREWTSRLATDLSEILGTKPQSVIRTIQRYEDGTRSPDKNPKYKAAIAALGAQLPPIIKVPLKRWYYEIGGTFKISQSTVGRIARATLDHIVRAYLQEIMDGYAADGTISGEEWLEGLIHIDYILIREI